MPTRRRFLAISAAAAATAALPARAAPPAVWEGVALGAAGRVTLAGAAPAQARRMFRRIEAALRQIEAEFSLFADSALVRLNRDGRLARPAPGIRALFELADKVHAATGGAFDPSIQPLWRAVATGADRQAAHRLVGWDGVALGPEEIRLTRPGMALTFNGIAQGAAADRIAALLAAEGFRDVLVDMGEIAALGRHPDGRPWQAAIALPDGTELARAALGDRALATSSPAGTLIGGGLPHILDPRDGRAPPWRIASVSARSAALADALSTAFCLMERPAIDRALAAFPDARLELIA